MYLPARFASPENIEEVVTSHPFATLITPHGSDLQISHLPLILEKRAGRWFLIGHMARANSHWRFLEGNAATAIFHGPHTYVTPLWYTDGGVPTWNYIVAHLKGRPRLLTGEEETASALALLSQRMDKDWRFEIPSDLSGPGQLLKAIVAFEIPVEEKAGKFKLSQNRSERDYAAVMQGLKADRSDENSISVRRWMGRLAESAPEKE